MFQILNDIESNSANLFKSKLLKRKVLYEITNILINTKNRNLKNIALKDGILEERLAELLFNYINRNSILESKSLLESLCIQIVDIVYIILSPLKYNIKLDLSGNIIHNDEFISSIGIEEKVLTFIEKKKEERKKDNL